MGSALALVSVVIGVIGVGPGHVAPVREAAQPAKLLSNGRLLPPTNAPLRVRKVIKAANRIHDMPYVYGGGHGSFQSSGYDCSGSVSYALHGGGFLDTPMDSSSLESWGRSGKGKWITVYTSSGHAYASIAGYRWDTSGGGDGPSWQKDIRSNAGFIVRHPKGF